MSRLEEVMVFDRTPSRPLAGWCGRVPRVGEELHLDGEMWRVERVVYVVPEHNLFGSTSGLVPTDLHVVNVFVR